MCYAKMRCELVDFWIVLPRQGTIFAIIFFFLHAVTLIRLPGGVGNKWIIEVLILAWSKPFHIMKSQVVYTLKKIQYITYICMKVLPSFSSMRPSAVLTSRLGNNLGFVIMTLFIQLPISPRKV